MKKVLFVSALFLFTALYALFPTAILADCLPFRGSGGAQLPIKCFTDSFKATCSTNQECLDLINGVAAPPAGSDYIPPGWTAPNTNIDALRENLCEDGKSINTAIGCIPITDTNAFVGFLLRWAIGVGAGAAFLLIVVAAFQIMTSSGNPDRLRAGQELLTSAVAGLILLVFSVFILRVIGVDILKIPGFGK